MEDLGAGGDINTEMRDDRLEGVWNTHDTHLDKFLRAYPITGLM